MASQTRAHVIGVGRSADAAVRALNVRLDQQGRPSFDLVTGAASAPVSLISRKSTMSAMPLPRSRRTDGGYVVDPGGHSPGRSAPAESLADGGPGAGRRRNDRQMMPYNANPDSMRAALEALAPWVTDRRTWLCWARCLSWAPRSVTEHDNVGRLAVRLGISRVVAVGQGARPIHDRRQ